MSESDGRALTSVEVMLAVAFPPTLLWLPPFCSFGADDADNSSRDSAGRSASCRRSAMRSRRSMMASVSSGLPSGAAEKVAGAACDAARLVRCARIVAGSDSSAVRSERRKVGNEWIGRASESGAAPSSAADGGPMVDTGGENWGTGS